MEQGLQEFEQEKTLADYVAMLRRRWKLGASVFAGVFVVAALIALVHQVAGGFSRSSGNRGNGRSYCIARTDTAGGNSQHGKQSRLR